MVTTTVVTTMVASVGIQPPPPQPRCHYNLHSGKEEWRNIICCSHNKVLLFIIWLVLMECHRLVLLVYQVAPAHDTATNTEWQLPEVVLTQFVSPDDEHDVLETCRELK